MPIDFPRFGVLLLQDVGACTVYTSIFIVNISIEHNNECKWKSTKNGVAIPMHLT